MDWFVKCLRQYAVFRGRAHRAEYWSFAVICLMVLAILTVIDAIIGKLDFDTGLGLFTGSFSAVMLLPTLAVTVRRLHDTGRSGWWLLVLALPVVGWLLLLLFTVGAGERFHNAYGPMPPRQP